jgi:glycosyltransferase involved in cell wall biosynthesis
VTVRSIHGEEDLGTARGEVVVCVAAAGRLEDFVASLRSIVRHAPAPTRVVIHGAAGPAAILDRVVSDAAGDGAARIWHAPDAAVAIRAAAPADVVLVSAGATVAPGWLERLRNAALGDIGVATASAMSDRLPVGSWAGDELAAAAARVAGAAGLTRPRLPEPLAPCIYVRRAAIDLVGDPMAPSFAADCRAQGLWHVLADDVLVQATGPAAAHEPVSAPVSRAIGVARRALDRLSVVIDARSLGGSLDGTRVHVTELIGAVAATGEVSVTALVPANMSTETRSVLERLPGITLLTPGAAGTPAPPLRADVVHRPHQVSAPADLAFLAGLADRLVVTHQDLISFHNPAYFSSEPAWEGYRDLTRRALGAADRVLFFSEHVRADALTEELVEPDRAEVIPIGVDHALVGAQPSPVAPPEAGALPEAAEVVLCLGTDFRHKNRVFALRVVAELLRRHQWPGRLVLAGPHVRNGSSRDDERAVLDHDPALAATVIEIGEVSDAQREWLLCRATLVLYPTVHEGFGLIPYEAAERGVPCLWAAGTALSELLPDAAAGIVPWDAAATADRALVLMRDESARAENISAIRQAGEGLRWAATGRRLVEAYRATCDRPPTPAAAIERTTGLMDGGLSEDAIRLVGPGGALPRDLERPLLALLMRPQLARPVIAAIKAGYRASQRRGR